MSISRHTRLKAYIHKGSATIVVRTKNNNKLSNEM